MKFHGRRDIGSFQMRGQPLVDQGWTVDCDWCVKCRPVRGKYVVCDPLDLWTYERRYLHDPVRYWQQYRCDVLIATSPACAEVMTGRVELIPHAADPRIEHWHDPNGPIVYGGNRAYVGNTAVLRQAAQKIGRRLVIDHDHHAWRSLKGAALSLCIRHRASKLDRVCKPTVKVANAAWAGIPILATDDPAITSMWPSTRVIPPRDLNDVNRLSRHMAAALEDPPPRVVITHEQWLIRCSDLIEYDALVLP